MANKLLLKKSSVTNKVPLTTDLDYGELAVNYADGKIYYKTSTNTINSFTSTDKTVLSVDGNFGNITAAQLLTAIKTVDGASSALDADLLDGQHGSYYLDWTNITNKPDPVITVTLTGDVTGTANTTLTDLASGTVSLTTTIAANSVALGTDTTGNYVASITNGSYITGGNGGTEGAAITLAVDATTTNTASKVVARDASGNFSAGTITAALVGNASTATKLETARTINGSAFDGSSNILINQLSSSDDRAIAPSDSPTQYIRVGFTSWNNNNTSPYADFLHLRTYTDATGGNENLVTFRKDAIGMRIWQQAFGSATAYATYKDVAFTDSNITGSAAKLTTARTISLTGDVTGSVSFDGSADASITATIAANSVALGTDTTGNYVAGVSAGTGVTITGTAGEGWSPTIAIGQAVATTSNVTFNSVSIANIVTNACESNTLATTTKTQIASFPVASFRSGKILVQAYDTVTGAVQISELLVAHNGTVADATEYGVVCTSGFSIATFDVDINAGNVRLLASRTTANSTQYKVSETLMGA